MEFDDLKPARESAGRTLKEIADRTKIPIRHLRALENGRLQYWPRGLYVRAHARAYAQAAGLDATEVVSIAERLIEDLDREAQSRMPADRSRPVSRWWQAVDIRAWVIRA